MRSWLGVVIAAAVLVTGCGIANASSPSPRAASPEAKAAALASKLVAEMRFPAGTRPSSLRSTPKALRSGGPAGSHWAHAGRLLFAPVKPAAVWAVLLPHKPFNEAGSMGTAGGNGPTGSSALIAAPESGIAAAVADVTLEPWHNGTLIAAYGYATWLPVRTAAEHLNPRDFRSVTVTASSFIPPKGTGKRVFTSPAVIGKIAAFLNARPAAPELAIPCPMPATEYKATFAPAVKGGRTVTAAATGCLVDQLTVNGTAQPSVWDEPGGLGKLLSSLLHPSR